ncbi:unnamed protein product [Sphagnum troendelagicum]|uniref:DEAD-box RNA helicase n=1 Tax=Sphagnum troendelagicum TaxID=128251 RepID=A0ABP0UIJ1_9BRYO
MVSVGGGGDKEGDVEGETGGGGGEGREEKKPASFRSLGVCDQLAEACESLGWKTPTSIQVDAIPHAFKGHDLIGLAQTGSGKTAAFALPILQALLEKPQSLFACVLSPTRELAIQISEQFEALGSGIGVKCAVVVGGIDMMAQSIALARRPHIVVGTPGRLVDHLTNTKGFSLRTIKYLVLDEADRLLNMDFEQEIDEILKVIPKERHTYLFSATMTNKVAKLQRACLKNPVKVEVSSKYSTVDTLKQQYLFIPAKFKDCYLVYLLNELAGSTVMVFTRTCEATRRLALILRNLGLDAIPISGQMSQPKRLGALNKFKAARAGRSGRAISMVCQYDVELYQKIEELIGKKLPMFAAEEEEVLLLLEQVSEAQRLTTIHMREKDSTRKKGKRKGFGDDDDADHPASGGKRFKNQEKGKRPKKKSK